MIECLPLAIGLYDLKTIVPHFFFIVWTVVFLTGLFLSFRPIHTLRYYENLGLIRGRSDDRVTSNNYKYYDEQSVERIEIIQEAKSVGYTLSEIREILDGWYEGTLQGALLKELFTSKIEEIDARIRQLQRARNRLSQMRKEIDTDTAC